MARHACRAMVERMKPCAHRWITASSHPTSEGWVSYQRCSCGAVRALVNAEPVVTRPI